MFISIDGRTTDIKFVLCSSLTNPKFQEGGVFKNHIDSNDICPETGIIDYKGLTGTNLFVVPKA